MKTDTPVTIYLKDYRPPDFRVTHSDLDIVLDFQNTKITATHKVIRKNSESKNISLDCENMDVQYVEIDGSRLSNTEYKVIDNKLKVFNVNTEFTLSICNSIDPSQNTALSGLYKSGDMLCTQCEAEGYRRITPAIDRPDNLSTYRVKLNAKKENFPVLLCNGNLIEKGVSEDQFHYSIWNDPFPKPTYLFAIVAGNLSNLQDTFKTMSGRTVNLNFYARSKDIEKCNHAMSSLKKSMRWDEKIYGREYDLDLFNVVSVDDFNMGAMENKSLNIFNTKYVLADKNMATDTDFNNVEAVIAHEYFHNWTGNRITCRDWFQLSLKEGLTVFRDQEFSADMGSRGVKRIDDVNVLRAHQFREDASPLAHPVRPDSYQEINNFYTVTIYNKGAEVVRMLHNILGVEKFRKGTDLYFDTHDGQAVTTDDFVAAMESANNRNFSQFKYWYFQAGTPVVDVEQTYDHSNATLELSFRQSCPPTPGQKSKQPFEIPLKLALFSQDGEKLQIQNGNYEEILVLKEVEEKHNFEGIYSKPVISILRGFSAPITLNISQTDDELGVLLTHDDDPFNRWEAGQKLFLKQLLWNIECIQNGDPVIVNEKLTLAFKSSLLSDTDDYEFLGKLLTLPGSAYISEKVSPIDPQAIEFALQKLQFQLAYACHDELLMCYEKCQHKNTGKPISEEMSARSLRDFCLSYICSIDDETAHNLSLDQLNNSKCMTDAAAAITCISRSNRTDREQILAEFYNHWQHEPLVIDKWLKAQAISPLSTTLDNVVKLTSHPGFEKTNPNKVYSLILGFTHGNPSQFHASSGMGYEFIHQWIKILDPINPQVAARLASALNNWKKYRPDLMAKMQKTLENISAIGGLSRDVAEIVNKSLK